MGATEGSRVTGMVKKKIKMKQGEERKRQNNSGKEERIVEAR